MSGQVGFVPDSFRTKKSDAESMPQADPDCLVFIPFAYSGREPSVKLLRDAHHPRQ
jgi:hypothetical protein